MRVFTLDARLSAVASLVSAGSVLCDVGTDHAKLPVRLLLDGMVLRAIVSDIAEKPLKAAERTAEKFAVYNKMEFVLCDGIPPCAKDAADVFVIAGMGGGTIAGILDRAELQQGAHLILQPMSSAEDLRELLYGGEYTIEREVLAEDGKRQYVIIEARVGGRAESVGQFELIAGRFIKDERYLEKCRKRHEQKWSDSHAECI